MKKKYIQKLTGRLILIALLALLQIVFFCVALTIMSDFIIYFNVVMTVISIAVVIYILNKDYNPAYKLAWTLPILSFPLFGGLLYIISRGQSSIREFAKTEKRIFGRIKALYSFDKGVSKELCERDNTSYAISKYLENAGFPLYTGGKQTYLPSGEDCLVAMKRAIQSAEKYIFIESFIIREDSFFNELLELICEKVKQGIEVRIIYDGMGSLATLQRDFPERMAALGIKTMEFNPFIPVVTVMQNNRDHRKIFVVDGKIAITGGINIADEYINRFERFGHWKDTSIMIEGKAVRSFVLMFLQTWYMQNPVDWDMSKFVDVTYDENVSDGFAQPYCDSPLDQENTGERTYLSMISRAKNSIYITTPYLIPDNELVTALSVAAKSGIDVRIIVPHKPDKWYVHMVTRSFYHELIKNGVKIFEYTPGFIHAKTMVVDNERAIVGSVNFDYRSLYLHFESALFICHSSAVCDITDDFIKTEEVCEEITETKVNLIIRRHGLLMSLLKVFAPIF